jgi:hypothetical protein
MARPIEYSPIQLSFEEVAVSTGHEVFLVVYLCFTDAGDRQRPVAQAPINQESISSNFWRKFTYSRKLELFIVMPQILLVFISLVVKASMLLKDL